MGNEFDERFVDLPTFPFRKPKRKFYLERRTIRRGSDIKMYSIVSTLCRFQMIVLQLLTLTITLVIGATAMFNQYRQI